jgi:hypothetical protein
MGLRAHKAVMLAHPAVKRITVASVSAVIAETTPRNTASRTVPPMAADDLKKIIATIVWQFHKME